ncbi:MAG: hypothetical protein AAF215_18450 [Cyanobacteria bacterium P01_A01_bin.123]
MPQDFDPVEPNASVVAPAGFVAPGVIQSDRDLAAMTRLAAELIDDPIALGQFCDRVYELMRDDLQRQRERSQGYGRRF